MQMGDFGFQFALCWLQKAGLAFGTCVFAFGGVVVGVAAGAMKGQTTETGICRGAAIGAISGAIVALELFDSITHGRFLSKAALFRSIVNGKAYRELVSPAVLKAYQWQMSTSDGNVNEGRGIFDVLEEAKGMSLELISRLPLVKFQVDQLETGTCRGVSCTICLQDLMEGESVRVLPKCDHMFHLLCIDEWLVRNASCPVCRNQVD